MRPEQEDSVEENDSTIAIADGDLMYELMRGLFGYNTYQIDAQYSAYFPH